MYARLNLMFLEVLQDNKIHLRNVEEVKRAMEKIAKGPNLEGVDLGGVTDSNRSCVLKLVVALIHLGCELSDCFLISAF